MTCSGGKAGKLLVGSATGAAAALPFATGFGLMRLGGAAEAADWRMRAEGRITELERILVP